MDVRRVSYYFAEPFFEGLGAATPSSKETMLMIFRNVPDLPRPNGRARFRTVPLSTVIFLTKRFSGETPRVRALASAESRSFPIAGEDRKSTRLNSSHS